MKETWFEFVNWAAEIYAGIYSAFLPGELVENLSYISGYAFCVLLVLTCFASLLALLCISAFVASEDDYGENNAPLIVIPPLLILFCGSLVSVFLPLIIIFLLFVFGLLGLVSWGGIAIALGIIASLITIVTCLSRGK